MPDSIHISLYITVNTDRAVLTIDVDVGHGARVLVAHVDEIRQRGAAHALGRHHGDLLAHLLVPRAEHSRDGSVGGRSQRCHTWAAVLAFYQHESVMNTDN